MLWKFKGGKKMENNIAFCGINCSECPAYIATQKKDSKEIEKIAKIWSNDSLSFNPDEIYCDGCISKGKHFSWCKNCDIKNCCEENGLQNCAYCDDYACEMLKMNFDKVPEAKERLDIIRKKL